MISLSFRMRIVSTVLAASVFGACLPHMVSAADKTDQIIRLKSGEFTFNIMDANGVKPLEGADIVLTKSTDAEETIQGVVGEEGGCTLTVEPGVYVLTIDETRVAVAEFGVTSRYKELRIVMPKEELSVGAQASPAFSFLGLSAVQVAGIVAAAVAIPVALHNGGSSPATP